MKRFLRVAQGVDVMPVLLDLQRQPELWDSNRQRTTYANSPHVTVSDIWVRGLAEDRISSANLTEEYRSVFWPAWALLPSLRPIVFGMMAKVSAVELGSILITRLAPGAEVLPHSDGGVGWSPAFYNTKLHLTLAGSSLSYCAGDSVIMSAGECWTFDNLLEHSVKNPGHDDRIALIVSMRCEP